MSTETTYDYAEHNEIIQCALVRLTYDCVEKDLILYVPEEDCTDQSGAIEYAKGIDPRVKSILVISGDRKDIRYHRRDHNTDDWRVQELR